MDQLTTMVLLGAVFVGLYFIMIRPQQKRAKEHQAELARIAEGSRVMLTSGVLCTVRHLGTKQAVVEVSPGVELTLLRQAIVRVVPAEEEEFEYAEPRDPGPEQDGVRPVLEVPALDAASQPEPEVAAEPEPEVAAEPEPEVAAEPEPDVAAEPEPGYQGPSYSQPSYSEPGYAGPSAGSEAQSSSDARQQ